MPQFEFVDLNPATALFLDDAIEGLSSKPKRLQPKYFYDQKGSQIFDQICHLPEYYPTRTEIGILDDYSDDLEELLLPETALIEYGSGSSTKIKKLLDNTQKITSYIPIDISKEHLLEAAHRINELYPKLIVSAICADYTAMDSLPELSQGMSKNRAIFFPGSTIGNLEIPEAASLLKGARKILGDGGRMILGIDLLKDTETLKNAYDDKAGVTASFNLNILERMNSELNANFDLNNFEHEARFNAEFNRIEMHLVAKADHSVSIDGKSFSFKENESIHTECSHKYKLDQFETFVKELDFKILKVFKDPKELFAVVVLESAS